MSKDPSNVSYPLREKRRRANRAAFIGAARDLFDDRGFSNTTMEEIADGAELHVQTLYRHFPTKHAIFTAIEIETFRQAFADRDGDTLSFWRSHVARSAQGVLAHDRAAHFLQYVRNVKQDPKLTAARAEIRIECQEILARGIREDFDLTGGSESLPILVANMLWGGNADAVGRWSESGGDGLAEAATAMADEVIDLVRNQLGLKRASRSSHHE